MQPHSGTRTPPEDPVFESRVVARLSVLILTTFTLACAPAKDGDHDRTQTPAVVAAQRARLRHLRFSTDKEKFQWERAIQAIWKTPLGEMYAEYLFAPTEDHADLPLWARMMTERIYREFRFLPVRLAALQVMDDDLYVREQMTTDVNNRITVLQGHIDQERIRRNQLADQATIPQVTAATVLAIPFGSSYVRHRVVDTGRKVLRLPPIARSTLPQHPIRHAGRQATAVISAASLIWLFFTGAESLREDWYYRSKLAPKDEVLLLGLDDLVTAMDLNNSGQNHMTFPYVKPKARPAR